MTPEIDFSFFALFMRATFTVKLVMILLIAMSFWSWSIIIQKWLTYRRARNEAMAFDGAPFKANSQLNLVSETVVLGDIQIAGDGTPFVLLGECQSGNSHSIYQIHNKFRVAAQLSNGKIGPNLQCISPQDGSAW